MENKQYWLDKVPGCNFKTILQPPTNLYTQVSTVLLFRGFFTSLQPYIKDPFFPAFVSMQGDFSLLHHTTGGFVRNDITSCCLKKPVISNPVPRTRDRDEKSPSVSTFLFLFTGEMRDLSLSTLLMFFFWREKEGDTMRNLPPITGFKYGNRSFQMKRRISWMFSEAILYNF